MNATPQRTNSPSAPSHPAALSPATAAGAWRLALRVLAARTGSRAAVYRVGVGLDLAVQLAAARIGLRAAVSRAALAFWLPAAMLLVAPSPLSAQCTRLCSNQIDCCDERIVPILECVDHDIAAGMLHSLWGYDNPNPATVAQPAIFNPDPTLANNIFLEGTLFQGQPLSFDPGRRENAFMISFPDVEIRNWLLDGRFASASTDSRSCATRWLLPRLDALDTQLGGLDDRVALLEGAFPDLASELGSLDDRVTALEEKAFCEDGGGSGNDGGQSDHGGPNPQAERSMCDDDPYSPGLCTAYCVELDCDAAAPRGSAKVCSQVLKNYEKKSGGVPPPCACPCDFDLAAHLELLEDMGVDTGAGSLSCVPAVAPWSITFEVVGPPFPEGRIEYTLDEDRDRTCSAVVTLTTETLDEVVLHPDQPPHRVVTSGNEFAACAAALAEICAP